MTKTQAPRPPRFERRFNNGVYHVFDRAQWAPRVAAGLQKQADALVDKFNRGRP